MDIELNTMLVALMFVTILSMGIGNILGTLADVFNHATRSRRSSSYRTSSRKRGMKFLSAPPGHGYRDLTIRH